MAYIIRPAYVSGPPSDAQRTHSKFTEEPVIGAFHVRRGSFLTLEDDQYESSIQEIKTLLEAEAITVERVGEPAPIDIEAENKKIAEQHKADAKREAAARAEAAKQKEKDEAFAAQAPEAEPAQEETFQESGAAPQEFDAPTPASKRKGRK